MIVNRGDPGQTREQAVQSNTTRVGFDKSRWEDVPPPMILRGDRRTGRLWEAADYEAVTAESAMDAAEAGEEWPNN